MTSNSRPGIANEAVVRLSVKVVAGASQSRIVGWLGDTLRIRVTAPAERGKANAAVEQLLREVLGLPRGGAKIVSGHASPRKIVEIVGMPESEIRRRISQAAAQRGAGAGP